MRKGYVIIWVLFAFLLLMPLAFFSLQLSSSGFAFAAGWEKQTQALYCAEAGLMHAVEWVKAQNPPESFQASFAGGSYRVRIVKLDKKRYLIRSTGKKAGVRRTVELELADNLKVLRWEEEKDV
jgi:hypothetical protein